MQINILAMGPENYRALVDHGGSTKDVVLGTYIFKRYSSGHPSCCIGKLREPSPCGKEEGLR